MYSIFVGIDISKHSFTACALDNNAHKLFAFDANMDASGFSKLLNALKPYPQNSVLIAMESSGFYHIPLFSYLSYKNFHTLLLNPLLVSNFAKLSLRKTKTDKKDAFSIASFILHYHHSLPQNTYTLPSELKELVREREALSSQIARLKNDIEKLLSVTFPELPKITNPFSKSILNLIKAYPSAHTIRNLSLSELKSFFNSPKGRKPSISCEQILSAAQNSIAPKSEAKEFILSQKISTLLFLSQSLNEITNLITQQAEKLIFNDLQILTSIKGIGKNTAIHFLAEIENIHKFDNPKKLIAFMGIDPTVYESGNLKGKSRLSKRGNRHLRRVIWLMARMVIRFNPFFKAYFQKRIDLGLPYKKAIFAVAHKLVRIIYAMLTKKTLFAPSN